MGRRSADPGSVTGRSLEKPTSTRVSRSFLHQTHAVEDLRQVGAIWSRIAHVHHEVGGISASSGPEGFILLSTKLHLGSKPCAVQRCRAIELSLRGLFELFGIDLINRSNNLAAQPLGCTLPSSRPAISCVPDLGIFENLVDVPARVLAPEREIDG